MQIGTKCCNTTFAQVPTKELQYCIVYYSLVLPAINENLKREGLQWYRNKLTPTFIGLTPTEHSRVDMDRIDFQSKYLHGQFSIKKPYDGFLGVCFGLVYYVRELQRS